MTNLKIVKNAWHFGPFHQIFMPAKFSCYTVCIVHYLFAIRYTLLPFPLCFETTNQISLQSIHTNSSTATVCVKHMLLHSILCLQCCSKKEYRRIIITQKNAVCIPHIPTALAITHILWYHSKEIQIIFIVSLCTRSITHSQYNPQKCYVHSKPPPPMCTNIIQTPQTCFRSRTVVTMLGMQ